MSTSAAKKKHDDTSRDTQMYTVRITGNLNLDRKDISDLEIHVKKFMSYPSTRYIPKV